MYHRNIVTTPAAQFTRESPLAITSGSSAVTFNSNAVPFSATLTAGETYYYHAECDGFMGKWGNAKADGSKLMRLYLVSADGTEQTTTGEPGVFTPATGGTYYFKIVVEGAGETRHAWNFQITQSLRKQDYAPNPDGVSAGDGEVKIYAPGGSALGIFPLTESSTRKTELGGTDIVTLQWNDVCDTDEAVLTIPLGAYIITGGLKFRCIAPYTPKQTDEMTWQYEVELYSPVSALCTKPFFFYMEDLTETDFNITGEFKEFTDALAKAILKSTGETWTVSAPDTLGSRAISFSQTNIYDAIGEIADEWDVEWKEGDKTITFVEDATSSDNRNLTVGDDIGSPSSSSSSDDDYYNRYYAFGSTRNIVRSDYSSLNASVTSISEPRLKLPTEKWYDDESGEWVAGCPSGYVDYDDGSGSTYVERNACVKVYDDIYPQSDLTIKEITTTKKKTDEGEEYPVYSLVLQTKAGAVFTLDTTTYNKESNPKGQLISGLDVSINFTSGLLQGKEFELGVNGTNANKTIFTIVPDDSEEIMIPNDLILPQVGDKCIVFNIRMPDSYRVEAEHRLYRQLMEDIGKAHSEYAAVTASSNPVAGITGLSVGDKVTIINGKTTFTTRIVTLEQCLDRPQQWTITTGEAIRTSKVRQMTESVSELSGAVVEAKKSAVLANRAAYKASRELIEQVFDPSGDFFTETVKPLVVQTANLTVGTSSQQFVIDNLLFGFDNNAAGTADAPYFFATANDSTTSPRLHHYAIDPDNVRTWVLNKSYTVAYGQTVEDTGEAFAFSSSTAGCYIYAFCPKYDEGSEPTELNGRIVLTDKQLKVETEDDTATFHFLLGMLSSEITTDGFISRSVTLTYGETTINGRFLRTGRIQSADGVTYFDLDTGEIGGNIKFKATSDNTSVINSIINGNSTVQSAVTTANSAASSASSAVSTATAAKDAIDNLEVGGRNCLSGTGTAVSYTDSTSSQTYYPYPATAYGISAGAFSKGTTVTISFDYDATAMTAATSGGFLINSVWVALIAFASVKGTSGHITKTVTLTDNVDTDKPVYVQGVWTGDIKISNCKWEVGTVATAWTEAPEDTDAAISTAQTTATAASAAATEAQLAADKARAEANGGRNCLTGTINAVSITGKGTSTDNSGFLPTYLCSASKNSAGAFNAGTTVTLSFDYDATAVTAGSVEIGMRANPSSSAIVVSAGTSGHATTTYTLTAGCYRDSGPLYCNGKFSGTITVSHLMYEMGDSETAWGYAPEECTDYLRQALTEATAGTTSIDGGLVLSNMISVGSGSNGLLAGMCGTSQAGDGSFPMIWAGATAQSREGVMGAKFRVYNSGTAIMRNAKILGQGSGSTGMIMDNGAITFGKLTGDDIAAADKLTEITTTTYDTIQATLNGMESADVKDDPTVSKTITPTWNSANNQGGEMCSADSTTTLLSFTVGSNVAAGNLFFTPSGKVTSFAVKSSLVSSYKATYYNNSVSATLSLVIRRNGADVATIYTKTLSDNKNSSTTTAIAIATASASTTNETVDTTTRSIAFAPGDTFTLVAKMTYNSFIYTVPNHSLKHTTGTDAYSATLNIGLSYTSKAPVYNNVYFANGMFLSSANTQYFAVVPKDPIIFQARSSNALLKFGANGLLQSLNGGTNYYRANPLVLIVRLTYSSGKIDKDVLYNPLGKTVGVTRSGTGDYTVTHNLGHTNYTLVGSGHGSDNKFVLYMSVISRTTTTVNIRTSDDASPNDLTELEISFFDYKGY